jgi:hypothetical protein
MLFTTLKAASALALLSSLASCAPTSTPIYPPKATSQNFRLVANVTSGDLTPSINNFIMDSYHVGAGEDFAVLSANTSATTGRIFYVNGTAEEVYYGTSNVLSDEGTPLFPAGIIINDPNTSAQRSVSINAGLGQAGVGLTQFPDPISELQGTREFGSGFYACSEELPYGVAIQLFYSTAGDTIPEGCAIVNLLPQCSEGSGAEDPFGNTINCYPDVAAIDWTIYSTD